MLVWRNRAGPSKAAQGAGRGPAAAVIRRVLIAALSAGMRAAADAMQSGPTGVWAAAMHLSPGVYEECPDCEGDGSGFCMTCWDTGLIPHGDCT